MFTQRQRLIEQSVEFLRSHVLKHIHRPDSRVVLLWMAIGALCAWDVQQLLRDGIAEEDHRQGLSEHILELLDLAERGFWCQHITSLKLVCDHLSRVTMFDVEVRLLRVAWSKLYGDCDFTTWEAPFYLADSLLWLRRLTEAEAVLTSFKTSCIGTQTHLRAFVDVKLAVIAWERKHEREANDLVNKAMAMLDKGTHTYSINLCHLIKAACAPRKTDLFGGVRLTGIAADHADARQHLTECLLTPRRGGDEGFSAYMSLVWMDPDNEVSIMTSGHGLLQRPALHACLLASALARDLVHLEEDQLYGIMDLLDNKSLWSMRSMTTWTEVTRILAEKLRSRGLTGEATVLQSRAADMEARASSLLHELRRRCLKNRKGKKGARSRVVEARGDCVVCLLEVDGDKDASLPCMRQADDRLHRTCLEDWIDACRRKDIPPSCPHCRQDVSL